MTSVLAVYGGDGERRRPADLSGVRTRVVAIDLRHHQLAALAMVNEGAQRARCLTEEVQRSGRNVRDDARSGVAQLSQTPLSASSSAVIRYYRCLVTSLLKFGESEAAGAATKWRSSLLSAHACPSSEAAKYEGVQLMLGLKMFCGDSVAMIVVGRRCKLLRPAEAVHASVAASPTLRRRQRRFTALSRLILPCETRRN